MADTSLMPIPGHVDPVPVPRDVTPRVDGRVDLIGLGPRGEIWIVECKSSRADFTSDRKWQGYLDWCDRFFWAVDADFPQELLPDDSGLILSDAYDAQIVRMAPDTPLAPARRRKSGWARARPACCGCNCCKRAR